MTLAWRTEKCREHVTQDESAEDHENATNAQERGRTSQCTVSQCTVPKSDLSLMLLSRYRELQEIYPI